jgi:hypothetical protein
MDSSTVVGIFVALFVLGLVAYIAWHIWNEHGRTHRQFQDDKQSNDYKPYRTSSITCPVNTSFTEWCHFTGQYTEKDLAHVSPGIQKDKSGTFYYMYQQPLTKIKGIYMQHNKNETNKTTLEIPIYYEKEYAYDV